MLMSSSKALGVTPDCRPGFCRLPPLHVSGASFWCVGSCIITSVGMHTYVNMFTLQVLGQCCSLWYGFTIHLYAYCCFLYFAHSTSARSAETCWEINSVIAYVDCKACEELLLKGSTGVFCLRLAFSTLTYILTSL